MKLMKIIFFFLFSDPMEYFLLDSKTGELRTAKPLDKEALPDATGLINLTVRARELIDGTLGSDPLTYATTQASVTIRDVNDSPPTFNQKEYYVHLTENTAIGTPLPLDITVNDPDVGINSKFSLRLDDVSGVFDIEPKLVTGSSQVSIRVANGILDYENPNHRKFIVLIIAEETETSPKLSSTATLTVSIADANDNRPVFEHEAYSASISETANAGQFITTITAKDMDSGSFGDQGIRYYLSGTGSELFDVDTMTGAITVAKCPKPNKNTLEMNTDNKRRKRFIQIDDDNGGGGASYGDYNMESNGNESNYGKPTTPYSVSSDGISVSDEGDGLEVGAVGQVSDEIENGKYLTYTVDHHEINRSSAEHNFLSTVENGKGNGIGGNVITTSIPHIVKTIDDDEPQPGKAPCLDFETRPVYFLSYRVSNKVYLIE